MPSIPAQVWAEFIEVAGTFGAGVRISVAWVILAALFPAVRSRGALVALGVVSLPFQLGERLPNWLVLNLASWGLAVWLCRIQVTPAVRWSRACLAMFVLGLLYAGLRAVPAASARWETPAGGWHWAAFEMFLGLRIFTLFWEVGAGKVRVVAPDRFAIWTAMPFTCFGPVLKFSQFEAQWPRLLERPAAGGLPGMAWWRQWREVGGMLAGLVAIGCVDRWLRGPADGLTRGGLLVHGLALGPVGFLLAAGSLLRAQEILGQRFGLELPPSFRHPLGRTNLSDFWANWNMSVTAIFRDFFFFNRWGFRKANPYLNCVLLFTLVGVWHDSTPYWIIWGFLHGVSFAVFLAYRKYRDSWPILAWRHRIPGRDVASRVLTYLHVAGMWMLPPQVIRWLGGLGG